eukprot:467673-Prymnesium_polylepis.1
MATPPSRESHGIHTGSHGFTCGPRGVTWRSHRGHVCRVTWGPHGGHIDTVATCEGSRVRGHA